MVLPFGRSFNTFPITLLNFNYFLPGAKRFSVFFLAVGSIFLIKFLFVLQWPVFKFQFELAFTQFYILCSLYFPIEVVANFKLNMAPLSLNSPIMSALGNALKNETILVPMNV